jgi:hypothetical protein
VGTRVAAVLRDRVEQQWKARESRPSPAVPGVAGTARREHDAQ